MFFGQRIARFDHRDEFDRHQMRALMQQLEHGVLRIGADAAPGDGSTWTAERLAVRALDAVVLDGCTAAAPRRARLGPVDNHLVALHAAQMYAGRIDHDAGGRVPADPVNPIGALVVVARPDEDPVPRARGVDGVLDRVIVALHPLVRAHAQHARVRRRGGRAGQGRARDRERDGIPAAPLWPGAAHVPRNAIIFSHCNFLRDISGGISARAAAMPA